MSRATPQMRIFAKHLIRNETVGRKSSGTEAAATFSVSDKLRPHFVMLVGGAGYRALLSRALTLASTQIPWLRGVRVNADGTLEGLRHLHAELAPAHFLEGLVVLLAQQLGLLVAFIGPGLTLRLIHEIWPQISLNPADLAHGEKNEKTN